MSSCPFVVGIFGLNTFKLPQILLSEAHTVWVSASESLSNPCVVKSLPISELLVAGGHTEGTSHNNSTPHSHVGSIEVLWAVSSTILEINDSDSNTGESVGSGAEAAEDGPPVSAAPEI